MKQINYEKALNIFNDYIESGIIDFDLLRNTLSSFAIDTQIDLDYIIDNYTKTQKNLFNCSFEELENIKDILDKGEYNDCYTIFHKYKYARADRKNEIYAENERLIKAFDFINKFFNDLYKNFSNNFAYDLLSALGIRACPYCNLNYIDTVRQIDENGNIDDIVRPDFDHFFPKSKYTFFALSFFNLIPSCSECNSRLKNSQNHVPINPYIKDFDSHAKFLVKYNPGYDSTNPSDINSFRIIIDNDNDVNTISHIEVFRLNERYNFKKDYVSELLCKKEIYTEDFINEISKRFCQHYMSKSNLDLIIWGNFIKPEDINKRPLSKLTKDILEEVN